jgi:hypothetical protein
MFYRDDTQLDRLTGFQRDAGEHFNTNEQYIHWTKRIFEIMCVLHNNTAFNHARTPL